MITHLHLKFGSSAGSQPLVIETPPSVTILVGPNNAGKSLLLREIMDQCSTGQFNTAALVLDRVDFAPMDDATAQRIVQALRVEAKLGENVPAKHSVFKIGPHRLHLREDPVSFRANRP